MARVVVVGAGIGGQLVSLLLAPDHEVVLLERDAAAPPAEAAAAWEGWERRGVGQFKLLHFFLPRLRILLEEELPEVIKALDAAGALRGNPVVDAPAEITGGWREGDGDFEVLTARRPVYEAALASVLADTPSIEVRRGVAVAGLVTGAPAVDGVLPHVVGVKTDDGEEILGDLVVDATGRRSPLPRWLEEIGASPPEEELEDLGFVYYGRHFRSDDGSVPPSIGPLLGHYGSLSCLTLPADNGTWGIGLICAADDAELRALKDADRWTAVVKSLPLVAHWLDGEPIDDGVMIMAKLEDRRRRFVVGGAPVVSGVVAVADSWACTNPSVGRGASIGALHARALRDLLRTADLADAVGFVKAFDDATQATVQPWFEATQHYDRHRLGSMRAARDGVPYEPGDPVWDITVALERAAMRHPDVLRAYMGVVGMLVLPTDAVVRPGVLEATIELGTGPEAEASDPPGPSRAELVEIVRA
jgi:2-polyprenyl-6-methoxyphenol hydroxylase-like FAD-dependent oxidoreductase